MYKPKLNKDIRCPLEYGMSVVPILQGICQWSGALCYAAFQWV